MIGISARVIRSIRSPSFDEGDGRYQQTTSVEQLMKQSGGGNGNGVQSRGSGGGVVRDGHHSPKQDFFGGQAVVDAPPEPVRTDPITVEADDDPKGGSGHSEDPSHPSKSDTNKQTFTKESISPAGSRVVASSLANMLSENTHLLRPQRTQPNRGFANPLTSPQVPVIKGPVITIKVFAPGGGDKFMEVKVDSARTVKEIMESILIQYKAEGRMPPLHDSVDAYELRMVDDEDGTPDEDMPPLDKAREIGKFGVDGVALCPHPGYSSPLPSSHSSSIAPLNSPPHAADSAHRMSLEYNFGMSKKLFLKVHLEDNKESHVLQTQPSMTLAEVLSLLSKKKRLPEEMKAEKYKFLYMDKDDVLEMKSTLSEIKADELRLMRKIPRAQQPNFLTDADDVSTPVPSQFVFTKETACAYSEYKVIKTNQRGRKQTRVLGIDQSSIYNKSVPTVKAKSSKLSFHSVADKFSVQKKSRAMNTVVSCEVVGGRPQCFRISFHEGKKIVTREYETETKMECGEIVAKIQFLINYIKSTSPGGSSTQVTPS